MTLMVQKFYESKQYKKGIKAAESILKKFPDHGLMFCSLLYLIVNERCLRLCYRRNHGYERSDPELHGSKAGGLRICSYGAQKEHAKSRLLARIRPSL